MEHKRFQEPSTIAGQPISACSETDPTHRWAEQLSWRLPSLNRALGHAHRPDLEVARRRHVISPAMNLRFQASGKRKSYPTFELEAVTPEGDERNGFWGSNAVRRCDGRHTADRGDVFVLDFIGGLLLTGGAVHESDNLWAGGPLDTAVRCRQTATGCAGLVHSDNTTREHTHSLGPRRVVPAQARWGRPGWRKLSRRRRAMGAGQDDVSSLAASR
jgi:hypothetical protein